MTSNVTTVLSNRQYIHQYQIQLVDELHEYLHQQLIRDTISLKILTHLALRF